jgi:hypothetical protein
MHVRDRLDLLPLRQMVRIDGDTSAGFARRGLLDWLSRAERYQIVSHGAGGQILAAGERALAEAQLVLRQAYGPLVHFGAPTVHTYVDTQAERLMVPVMFVRIDAPRVHAQALLRNLEERCAQLGEVDRQRDRVVVRADLELRHALGLEREVGELTDGAAHILSWLLRYQPAAADWRAPDVRADARSPMGAAP